jgi:hypothetical protein
MAADSKDATEVVTDPGNLDPAGDRHTGERRVNEKRAVSALRKLGAKPAEARALIAEAVTALGGRVDQDVRMTGRAAGSDRPDVTESWFVPTDKVRTWHERNG